MNITKEELIISEKEELIILANAKNKILKPWQEIDAWSYYKRESIDKCIMAKIGSIFMGSQECYYNIFINHHFVMAGNYSFESLADAKSACDEELIRIGCKILSNAQSNLL